MPITTAQYDFIALTMGTARADEMAAQSGGVSDASSAGFVTLTEAGMPTVQVIQEDPGAFYGDGPVVSPTPQPWVVPTPEVRPADVPSSAIDPGGALVLNPPVGGLDAAGGPMTGVLGGLVAGGGIAAAMAVLRVALRGATRVTAAHWSALPNWARTVLVAAGIGVGYELAQELPGIRDIVPGGEAFPIGIPGVGDSSRPDLNAILGVTVIGSWRANGVTFYRLSDGKLAVQNKHGRWKVWKPKKPIVLYASGATDIPTLLRADNALNKQSKKIAKMLNRRAPKPRKSRVAPSGGDGTTITQVKA